MNLFKAGVKFGLLGMLIGLLAGALSLTLALTLSGAIFIIFHGNFDGAPLFFSVAMSAGSMVGGALGALAGILGASKK